MALTRSSEAGIADVEVVVRGDVPAAARAEAERKITSLARYVRQPIPHARIRLTRLGDPAVPRPVIAQGNLNVRGRLVRAQVAAHTATEAVDLLQAKLRHRLTRLVQHFQDRRGALPRTGLHEWRHGQETTHRPASFPRPPEQRQVVRHKAYQLARATPDEAAFDMDLMDYDFHLFTDEHTGQEAVIYRAGPTGYRLAGLAGYRLAGPAGAPAVQVEPAVPLTISQQPAPRLHLAEAVARLNATGLPFLFFAEPTSGRGRVLYRRYDGHHRLIIPAG